MTIEVVGFFDSKGKVHLADQYALDPLRKIHKAGEACRVVFSDDLESKHEVLFRLFHKDRDIWANKVGYTPDYAKAWLKWKYGVSVPYRDGFKPPLDWKYCRFVEIEGQIHCLKSTLTYSYEELCRLEEGVLSEING